jgi:hypothetical protein
MTARMMLRAGYERQARLMLEIARDAEGDANSRLPVRWHDIFYTERPPTADEFFQVTTSYAMQSIVQTLEFLLGDVDLDAEAESSNLSDYIHVGAVVYDGAKESGRWPEYDPALDINVTVNNYITTTPQ